MIVTITHECEGCGETVYTSWKYCAECRIFIEAVAAERADRWL